MAKRLGILTGGGDCPGLNPAVRGCVLQAARLGWECAGFLDGWKGLVEAQSIALRPEDVEDWINKGGTLLGSSRTNPFKREGGPELCRQNFKKLGLDALVAMGGEDTLGVAARLYREFGFPVVGVPKTMDNDLSATDFTFGFDTAATIAVDAAERLKDTGRSHHRAMVLEVMGRHAGWVALYTGLASGADFTVIPEKPVSIKDVARAVKSAHRRKKHALVVASEAIVLEGDDASQPLDEFGHNLLKQRGVGERLARAIEKETGIETRCAVIGHIQRGGPPTLFDRILATRAGVRAAQLADEKRFGVMVALKGNRIEEVSLEEATGKLKTVGAEWLELLRSVSIDSH